MSNKLIFSFSIGCFILISILAIAFYYQLTEAQAKSAELQIEADQSKNEVTQLQNQITTMQPEVANARRLPLKCAFRKAFLGGGLVLEIKNESSLILPLKIMISNTTFNRTVTVDKVLNGGAHFQLGPGQGTEIAPADEISIKSENYDAMQVQASL